MMSSKPSYPSEGTDSRILRGYCGSESSAVRPKLYLGPGPVPRRYLAEDKCSVAEAIPKQPPQRDVNGMRPIGKQGVNSDQGKCGRPPSVNAPANTQSWLMRKDVWAVRTSVHATNRKLDRTADGMDTETSSCLTYKWRDKKLVIQVLFYLQEQSTGNFVLQEQSTGRQLWQSFDYPTHTLLPGMKLGVNQKTGHTWSLRSWRGEMVPEVGSFTFGLDPNQTNRLVILWHGNIYWTSEPWNNSQFKLPYSSNDFSYVSNENETYFNYSVGKDITTTPRLLIDYLGKLNDSSGALVSCSRSTYYPIYFGMTDGCAVQKLPECKGPGSNLYILPSIFKGNSSNGFEFNESDNLTIVDCQAKA
uniref:Bulb-type lectin domain-containing protein n=1 Tax=Quercus lobata TaxID=97700 RepID=A0A7N2LM88_QUELO